VSIRLSREKINFLGRLVLNYLFEDKDVEFLDEPNEIRLNIVRSIEDEIKLYDTIDQKAIDLMPDQDGRVSFDLLIDNDGWVDLVQTNDTSDSARIWGESDKPYWRVFLAQP